MISLRRFVNLHTYLLYTATKNRAI